ncbi:enoyl-CoA hydratase/isomerase family protein [Gordonia sp. HY002]|uniref:enoyl-CoA hydratase/isomerase family protein n=1 Tax=Gordonia zhenghanii TaxID=2911516 RepID=UPI001EEFCB9B|nr:enoyl-CoA hydratase/isomerase family protein [Gordonia zhenghanii]MCF8570317.1 enoyl-CoA hydratase/isomerase family protein [Gordonia zhenghanii]MCF8605933.1 enoyl-CoA hydratase/isomerase family protein [Gordonia zhenghanii]
MSYIRTSVSNGVGEIVLDRPKALNALDQSMIDDLYETLTAWGDDDAVETVLVTSSSDRAFCAGGDIRAIRDSALAGDTAAVTKYFASEYRVNQLIAEYPKPYVALVDGAAMGGGLGISVHGEIRVVTEKALIAMPETAIGFFPDVGATYFLPRLPAGVGMWLGLTGARVRGSDAVALGLATHYVPSEELATVADSIRSGAGLAEALADHRDPVEPSLPLRKIADYFGDVSVDAVVGGLRGAVGDDWAEEMLALLGSASPTSLFVTARLLEEGGSSSLAECLERELSTAEKITAHPDFAEGVRAVLVDKDRNPSFTPPTIAEVSPEAVAEII